jgi:hypothetical protein
VEVGYLAQRHRCAGGRLYIDIVQGRKEIACVGRLAQHDLDGLVPVAELTDLGAREHRLQRAAHALRRHAKCTGAILIDFELQARHRLDPVVVYAADNWMCAHRVADLSRQTAYFVAIGARHAHLHRPADRRTIE